VLIGVSSREGSVGNVVLRNVIAGRIYPVNPRREELTLLMGRVLREKIAMLSLCTSLGFGSRRPMSRRSCRSACG
jgi:hypothetical protein